MKPTISSIRKTPIPCKVCGILFSGRIYRRYNCDLHYRQKTEEVEKIRSERISKTKTGSKRPPFSKAWKDNLSKSAQHGSKCWKWKGGVTSVNEKIRKSAKYVNWRNEVFARDNHTCVLCNKRGGDHHADHIKPFAYFPELRFELTNGRTLCVECHRKTDTYGEKCKNYDTK